MKNILGLNDPPPNSPTESSGSISVQEMRDKSRKSTTLANRLGILSRFMNSAIMPASGAAMGLFAQNHFSINDNIASMYALVLGMTATQLSMDYISSDTMHKAMEGRTFDTFEAGLDAQRKNAALIAESVGKELKTVLGPLMQHLQINADVGQTPNEAALAQAIQTLHSAGIKILPEQIPGGAALNEANSAMMLQTSAISPEIAAHAQQLGMKDLTTQAASLPAIVHENHSQMPIHYL